MQSEPPRTSLSTACGAYNMQCIGTLAGARCERACIMTHGEGNANYYLFISMFTQVSTDALISPESVCGRNDIILRSWLRRKLNCDTVNNFKPE
jgi:hypothetical protein